MNLRPALLTFLALAMFAAGMGHALAAAPVVSNVRSVQRAGTQLVDIDYDLADPDSATLAVMVAMSINGGATYDFPATSFSGALGNSVSPGVGKRITWNAGQDWPNGFSANIRFRITASDNAPAGMALVPTGSFQMGDSFNEGYIDARPVHTVYVSAFYMDRYEVTKGLWEEVYQWATNHGYSFDNAGVGKATDHPVVNVFWYDAIKWCNARSEKEDKTPAYYVDSTQTRVYRTAQIDIQNDWVKWNAGYRLPTEAEWEKAARGGASGRRFPWGDADTITHSRANYKSSESYSYDVSPTRGFHPNFATGFPQTSPVGYFAPNGYGLYDMAGNVWEYCWDRYLNSYYSVSPGSDPRGPTTGSLRLLRGGGWGNSGAQDCRVAFRYGGIPNFLGGANGDGGFRSVLPSGPPSADSNATTVDTRDNLITVSGRVVHSETRSGLAGVLVSLGGHNTITYGDGAFTFDGISLASGQTLGASKPGFSTTYRTVAAPAGAAVMTLRDIFLFPVAGTNPVVTSIMPKYDGIFPSAAAIFNDYTVAVDWAGHPPGSVEFRVNGTLRDTVATATTEATASINMGLGFNASLTVGRNKITAVAVSTDGTRSQPFQQPVAIIPAPAFLSAGIAALAPFQFLPGNDPALSFDIKFPADDIPSSVLQQTPLLGNFGSQFAVGAGFEYALNTGEWQIHAGIEPYGRWASRRGERPHSILTKPKFFAGNRTLDLAAEGRAEGRATQTAGIVLDRVSVGISVDYSQELLAFYLSDYVPGAQWLRVLDWCKKVGVDPNSIQRVTLYGELGFDVQLTALVATRPVKYDDTTLELSLGLRVAYEPNVYVAHGSIYAAGKMIGEFQIHPGLEFHKITGALSGGITFTALGFEVVNEKFTLIQYSWSPSSSLVGPQNLKAAGEWIRVAGQSTGLRPRPRDYLALGGESFPAYGLPGNAKSLVGGTSPLDAFRSMGSTGDSPVPSGHRPDGMEGDVKAKNNGQAVPAFTPVPRGESPRGTGGSPVLPKALEATPGLKNGGAQFAQVDLPLVQNIFPDSQPVMAAHGSELMLLYVADSGASNALQFTDIKWTRFDGTNWDVPAPVHTNTQAEFSPQVAYDGNGDAIAVWERVADANFNETNLTAMAAQMEIVWSRWNHTNGAWTPPLALTANGYLDHAPLLCGPMANGDVLLTWTKNEANLLMGAGPAGSVSNSVVMQSRWSAASQTWDAPQVLVADLPYRLSQSLAGVSNLAVYAWTRDLDGVLTNSVDQQVFYCAWSNGVWSAPAQFTTNSSGNRNARVAVGVDAHSYLIWQRGADLVLSRDFSTNITVVRADSQTAGFADYAMTIGPAGNLALLWQEMSQDGSDAHYSILDPASATWSKDARLFQDAPLERSFAPVWDDVGNLTVAYNKVQILVTNETVTLEGGGTITITNVPQPGRVDLSVTKRRLVKDVELRAGDFTVESANYLPGAAVTLSATVRNVGDVAVSNLVVAFYDGNPTNGGTLITNIALSGWLEGAATNTFTALWVVPEPATNHVLYAVTDPTNAITEFNETNNVQSVSIGGVDLAVSLLNYTVETNGAVRVIAQVQNLGAPTAGTNVLAIRRAASTNAPLTTVAVPTLEPGRLAQLALDLAPGTQPEGESIYTLRADESSTASDVDTNNNTSTFAVNLWLDTDGDGMPDGWELANSLNLNDPADAGQDADGDGMSNLAEYRAGTNPNNPQSYLRLQSIAAGGTNGVQITWGSASNKLYAIQRAGGLVQGGATFTNLAEHILSTPPQNSFLDTTATNSSQFFYRLTVE